MPFNQTDWANARKRIFGASNIPPHPTPQQPANYAPSWSPPPERSQAFNGQVIPQDPDSIRTGPRTLANPAVQAVLRGHNINYIQTPGGQVDVAWTQADRSFWENPQRVVRYRDFLRSAPPDWQAPDWMPAKEIEAAYQYLKFRNDDKPWQDWKALPPDDPGASWLQSLPAPPTKYLLPEELRYGTPSAPESQPPFADWDKLPGWARAYASIFAPQPGMTNRPEGSRLLAAGVQGAMGGLGGAAAGTAIGGPLGGLIGFLGVGGASAYQAYTGTEIPVVSQVMQLFNLPAMGLERGIGMAKTGWEVGWDELVKNWPSYWEANQVAYEAGLSPLGSNLINQVGPVLSAGYDVAHALGLAQQGGGWAGPAGPGEVWKITQGYATPQQVEGTAGVAATTEYAQRLRNNEDPVQLYLEYTQRFGDTGSFNDFISQTVLDPMNLAPFAEGVAGEAVARAMKNPRLAEAFKQGRGNLAIDVLPFGVQQIVSGITKIKGSEGLLGSFQNYRNWVQRGYYPDVKGMVIKPAAELSNFEKWAGGLDQATGIPKELLPTVQKQGIAGVVQYLTTLTPASKAHLMESATHDNLNVLLSMAGGDPEQMVKMLDQAMGAKPVQAGDLGEQVLASPMTAAVAAGLSDALKDGTHHTMLAKWVATEKQRTILTEVSKKLGMKDGELLEQLNANPDATALRISQATQAAGTPDQIKALFKPFIGEDPDPWNAEMFQAQLALSTFDHMDQWIAKRFDLKPDATVFRMSQTLKGMQSLLLLGLNPAYFINNAFNNAVTRGAAGCFGFMTPRQIDQFMKRFGITPDRLRVGIDPSNDLKSTSNAINAAMHKGDWIDKAQSAVDAVNQKMGLFSRFSATNERSESGIAYAIGMDRFMRQNWKRGVGFRKLDPLVEAMLDRQAPGVKGAIYSAIEAGMNIDEINSRLLGDYIQPGLTGVVEESARKVYPDNPDLGMAIIHETGILPELEKTLATAGTPEEVNAAFSRIEQRLSEFVDEAATRDLVHQAAEVRNQVQQEGFPAALGLFVDLQVKIGTRWLGHFGEWQDLYNRRGEMTREEFDTHVRSQMATDSQEWKRINDFEQQTYAGIIQALGMESPAARQFIDLLTQSHANWRRFYDGWDETTSTGATLHHDGRNEKLKKFFATFGRKKRGETEADYANRFDTAWRRLQDELADDYRRATAEENRLQRAMDEHFARSFEEQTHQPQAGALQWREQVAAIRMQMQESMSEFRAASVDMLPETRRAAWTQFLQEYNALIVELKRTEIEGAWTLTHQPPPEGPATPVAEIQHAVPPPPEQIAQPGEAEINAAATGQGETQSPRAQANLGLALRYGITDRAGKPIAPYLLNIINKRQPEGQKFAHLGEVPPEIAESALVAHQAAHAHEDAQIAARQILDANDILQMADAAQREAAIHAAGMLARRHVREKLLAAFNAKPEEVEAALLLMDYHADRVARLKGQTPSDASRDAWYATHIANILNSGGVNELFQRTQQQRWYYSQLLRTAEQMPPKMTADALAGFLKGKVKAEELRWTGFEEWLAEKRAAGAQVTKAEVTEFLQANQVHVTDILLGGDGSRGDLPGWNDAERTLAAAGYRIEYNPDDPAMLGFVRTDAGEDWDIQVADEMPTTESMNAAFKLEQLNRAYATGAAYTLLPEFQERVKALREYGWDVITRMDDPSQGEPLHFYQPDPSAPDGIKGDIYTADDLPGLYSWWNQSDHGPISALYTMQKITEIAKQAPGGIAPRYEQYREPGGKGYRELLLQWERPREGEDAYTSPHWDQKNVLAHVRFDERTNEKGERVLFVEEIQSDWHEHGRKDGYQGQNPELVERYNQLEQQWLDLARQASEARQEMQNRRLYGQDYSQARQHAIDLNRQADEILTEANRISKELEKGVPAAPFAKDWESLVVKRVIRWAAEEGYDRVAFATGKMNADRYSLTKYIDELSWNARFDEGDYLLSGTKNGKPTFSQYVKAEDLQDVVGVEVAARIRASEGAGRLEGEGLSVGGQGMRQFYDVMIPSLVGKYIKKWGGQIERSAMPELVTRSAGEAEGPQAAWHNTPDEHAIFNEEGQMEYWNVPAGRVSEFLAEGWTSRPMSELVAERQSQVEQIATPSFAVTPAMREAALAGQPLFQRGSMIRPDSPGGIFYQRGMPAEDAVARIEDSSFVDPASIVGVFQSAGGPYLGQIAQFILGQRHRYVTGQMTARDVAKAYLLTISSIGSDAKTLDTAVRTFLRNGIQFTRDGQAIDLGYYAFRHGSTGEWNIRPEELTAAWLMSDQGQRALNNLAATGDTTEFKKFIAARRQVYGRFEESFTERRPGRGKLNLEDIDEITRLLNEAGGDPDAVGDVVMRMAGIAGGKVGFVKHLLGFGDEMTLDIQEINFWTGHMIDEADAQFIRERWRNAPEITGAVKKRVTDTLYQLRERHGIGADLPEEAFAHVMHHWLWDAQKHTRTTHQGMYRAMQFAQESHASVEFLHDSRAIIRALNQPNISSVVHEIGHIFRRDLPAGDLDIIARWGGLESGEEMTRLQQLFQSGDPDWMEYSRLRDLVRNNAASPEEATRFNELDARPELRQLARYEDAEEKFARGWEKYLAEGDAPTPELRSIFRRFTDWMLEIYKRLKRAFGKVEGFEQQVELAGIDLNQRVNGVRIRDIFDRLLVDEPNRPLSLDQLMARRIEGMKKQARYSTYSASEVQQLAQMGVLNELLHGDASAEEALARATRMVEDGTPYRTDTGEEIDPLAVYDAARLAQANPIQAPWTPEAQRIGGVGTAEPKLSARERALLHEPTARLPQSVQAAIRATAQVMLDDIRAGGTARLGEGEESLRTREGNAPWYWSWYDQAGKPAGFKRTMRTALEKIIAGTEDAQRPMVRQVKNQIMSWLTGEEPSDMGPIPDPAVLWYLGRKGDLFRAFANQLDSGDPAWLERSFGAQQDQVIADYIHWLETAAPEPEGAQVAPVEPLKARVAQEAEAEATATQRFEAGEAIPVELATGMTLLPGDPLPHPAAAEETILKGLRGEEEAYAQDLIDWVELGEHGDEPQPPAGLGLAKANRTRARVQAQAETLRTFAKERNGTPVSQAAPGAGLQVQRAHLFRHGEHDISAIVTHDGTPVAYLPIDGEALRPFGTDGARLLGLDPTDPQSWIVLRGNQVIRVNPEAPALPAMPKAVKQPRTDLPVSITDIPRSRYEETLRSQPEQPGETPEAREQRIQTLLENHRNSVERALAEGRPTPPEVLADYPDLAAAAANEPPQMATAVDLFGEPAERPFTLEAQRAEAEQFKPKEQVPNEELFNRAEYLPEIKARQAGEEPPWVTRAEKEVKGGQLFQRARQHPYETSARELLNESQRIRNPGFVTQDGTILEFRRQARGGITNTHPDIADDITGQPASYYEFVNATHMMRVDVAPNEVLVELHYKPTVAQIMAILNSSDNKAVSIDLTRPGELTPFEHQEFWGNDKEAIVEYLSERARLKQTAGATYTPMVNVSNLESVPSPLSGYVGNKRSMLQAGHYNEILSNDAAARFTRIVEGFGGSGLLGNAFQYKLKLPRVYNEFDPKVVAFHKIVKERPQEIIQAIQSEADQVAGIMKAYPEGGPDAYDAIQNLWKGLQFRLARGSDVEQAALLAINNSGGLSIMGGGAQKIISGASVKEGSYVWRAGEDSFQTVIDNLRRHSELLKATEIVEGDARQRLQEATPSDLVLLDPPYVSRGIEDERAMGYAAGQDLTTLEGGLKFIEEDMAAAAKRGIGMIYTNNAHPVIVEALRENGFHIRLVKVRSQNVRGEQGARVAATRTEVIGWNDPVGPADAGWRGTSTTETLREVGSGRADLVAYRARSKRLAAQHERAAGVVSEGDGAGARAVGDTPLGGTPVAEPFGATADELSSESLRPLLRQMRDDYQTQLKGSRLRIKGLDPDAQREVGKYLRRIEGDLASTKYAAMGYGEQLRDASLLNYSRRYGFDNWLGLVAPYQFWYTRSMVNWAKRMIDRPGWFAMYARFAQMQERTKRNMPTRLKGKMRIPAPWLPSWAGGGIWSDPLGKIFPFKQFGQPLEQFASDKNMIERRAESLLNDMVEAQTVSAADADKAKRTHQGETWKQAIAQAQVELDKNSNPASLVTTLMQPALWWTALDAIASGKPEKISPLPVTRTAQALRTATQGTALESIGRIGGLLAAPEEAARKGAGLSQFGEWGDYYIDRTLANMAADGTADPRDVRAAMIERAGPLYDEAVRRTEYEQMLRTPGAPTLNQLAQGNLAGAVQSLPTLLFPGGLFPEGELAQRGLKVEYDRAWQRYKNGDETALRSFFDNNPEYEARLALYAKPEDRLQQFLVNEIWDRYYQLDRPNQTQARRLLGQQFEDAFMNKETRAYDAIPVETLALWSRMLGGIAPRTKETEAVATLPQSEIPTPNYWSPEVSQAIQTYQQERDSRFPGYYAIQDQYYRLPQGAKRKSYLARFPQLRQYWDWKKAYQQQHPELTGYFEQAKAQAGTDEQPAGPQELAQVSAPLSRAMLVYLLGGGTLSTGAKMELNRLLKAAGRSITPEEYARLLLAGMVAGGQ